MDTAYENNGPTHPYVAFAPFNFRGMIQRQINTSVDSQVDAVVKMSAGKADGRYSTSRPANVTLAMNPYGLPYFAAGSSIVGRLYVAAP
jgi:hypothetical protein